MHHAVANATASASSAASDVQPNSPPPKQNSNPVLPPLISPTTKTRPATQLPSLAQHYSHSQGVTTSVNNGLSKIDVSSQTIQLLPSSQDTIPETAFTTPAASQEGPAPSAPHENSHQLLLQLSQIAATRQKMAEPQSPTGMSSRKRTADGSVKPNRECSGLSPVRSTSKSGLRNGHGGHSRNPSTLSTELKTRLSYAMIKVHKGWQARSLEEVETLISQAASPASSSSTLHGRQDSSASPQIPFCASQPLPQTGPFEMHWKNSLRHRSSASPPSTSANALAPPAPIHASQASLAARRNSRSTFSSAHLAHSHQASPSATPHTPAQPSSMQSTPVQQGAPTPVMDPILFSPDQNAREQEAIESLIFMGSPGNAAGFSPRMAPPTRHSGNQVTPRTALPSSRLSQSQTLTTSPARKSLPSGRPSNVAKRVGFDKTATHPVEMDVDDACTSRTAGTRANTRRKLAGGQQLRPFPVSSGLSVPNRPRPKLGDEDIERMLDNAGAGDDSDSDGEIQIPVRAPRAGAIGA